MAGPPSSRSTERNSHELLRKLNLVKRPRVRSRRLHESEPDRPFILVPPPRSIGPNSTRAKLHPVAFSFALISDTHFWVDSASRVEWDKQSDKKEVRDGLLVGDSQQIFGELLRQLVKFKRGGGSFAVHAGDAVCGGASFNSPISDYEASLHSLLGRSLPLPTSYIHLCQALHFVCLPLVSVTQNPSGEEQRTLGGWPVYHVPGNHDMSPGTGGLAYWRKGQSASAAIVTSTIADPLVHPARW